MSADAATADSPPGGGGLLDWIERAGNRVPNPVMMFLYLIIGLAVLSAILAAFDVSVTEQVVTPVPTAKLAALNEALGGSVVPYDSTTGQPVELPDFTTSEETFSVNSLLSIDGIRYIASTFVSNFAGFSVVAVTLVAMAGVGAAEKAGLMAALIRRLVAVAPPSALAFILVFVGVLSSVASDAGYLILIPLGAAAFMSVGRHPLAGLAASFAGVGAIFGVNILITPVDSMLTEITNEAIALSGGEPITVTANWYFSIVCTVVLSAVAAVITTRIVEKRLGVFDPANGTADEEFGQEKGEIDEAGEKRGLRFAFWGMMAMIGLVVLATAPSGAPLRDPDTGAIIGNTPFMASLIFIISLMFLVCGICYGRGARTMTKSDEVIQGINETYAGLGGLLLMFLMIAEFIAFFNYTNLPRVIAVNMANLLERVNVPALLLLIGLIVVIALLDFILPGVVPKWAIFAPVFIPIFTRLDVAPQTVLAAYRVGDSPPNVLTPLMVYFPFIVTIARRYQKDAGIGSIIALLIPYAAILLLVWIVIFAGWYLLGIPWGPDSPVHL